MQSLDRTKLIEIGLKKRNGEIDLTWQEVGHLFNIDGERARDIVKKHINKSKNNNITRILCISDLHIPFHLPNLLDILSEYAEKVDILLFNGDEEDCFSISKFRKKYRVPFVDELIQTRQLIIDILNLVKPRKTIFNYGNHNVRFIKYMSDNIRDDLLELMPQTNLELLIEDGFYKRDRINGTKTFYEPLKQIIKNIEIEYTHNWYCQIGDVLFCHPSAYKNSILKTVADAWTYFLQRRFNFSCLVCSHTHSLGFYKYGDCFIYETGCLCVEPDYAREGKLLRPQTNGMFYCVLKDGRFDYTSSKLVVL